MKREYAKPKAMLVNYCYDEQITADSGHVSGYGDPAYLGKCQQSSPVSCRHFWSIKAGEACDAEAHSRPGGNPVVG